MMINVLRYHDYSFVKNKFLEALTVFLRWVSIFFEFFHLFSHILHFFY